MYCNGDVVVSDETDVSVGCPSNYRLSTCVRALFHIDIHADAYLPCLLNMNLVAHL
jgi:hypothetical protein